MILPEIKSRPDYVAVYADTDTWLPAMRAICDRHSLDAGDLRREVLGTHVVFRTGSLILKLFSSLWPGDFRSERAVLAHLRDLPVPELVAEGEIEGWPYLVITSVPGVPALDVWGDLDLSQKTRIMTQLGQFMRQLHDHPPVPELATDWNAFLRERIENADEHHRAEEPWRTWIRDRLAAFSFPSFDPVLISADITEDHLLLSERNGVWDVTGLIDFGDARMGHSHYEFIAPLAFYTFGKPDLSHTLVEAYGLPFDSEIAASLTTYCLLHEFGRLADFLKRYPASDGPDFHRALWGDL